MGKAYEQNKLSLALSQLKARNVKPQNTHKKTPKPASTKPSTQPKIPKRDADTRKMHSFTCVICIKSRSPDGWPINKKQNVLPKGLLVRGI